MNKDNEAFASTLTPAQKKCKAALAEYMCELSMDNLKLVAQIHYVPGFLPTIPEEDTSNLHHYLRVCAVLAGSGVAGGLIDLSYSGIQIRSHSTAINAARIGNGKAFADTFRGRQYSLVAFISKVLQDDEPRFNHIVKDFVDKCPGSHGMSRVVVFTNAKALLNVLSVMEVIPDDLACVPG